MAKSEKEMAALVAKNMKQLDFLKKHLSVGDTITHTVCSGCIEEHIFKGVSYKGRVPTLCGHPTHDTKRIDRIFCDSEDILPCNVTHVNRVPLHALPYIVKKEDRRKI